MLTYRYLTRSVLFTGLTSITSRAIFVRPVDTILKRSGTRCSLPLLSPLSTRQYSPLWGTQRFLLTNSFVPSTPFVASRSLLTRASLASVTACNVKPASLPYSLWTNSVKRALLSRQYTTPPRSGGTRPKTPQQQQQQERVRTSLFYTISAAVLLLGLSYAAVPLYRLYCSVMGAGGKAEAVSDKFEPENLVPRRDARRIRVTFNSDVSQALNWSFKPQQKEVYVYPGETALVFYTAKNNSDRDLIGISTYNVTPSKAGAYFNKIQCFCFEEQLLRAGEQVDMPIFFFLDPDFCDQPQMRDIDSITLSYTFFNAKQC
ncbi:cytochrome c oxidase assembly protein CtaG/Cox11-domain-containing protein [Syncephalis plumigaleata]|nr:cytochrome c oxidase assembly protein CtaG/Cox11-domain-containing protein [Syncephalis plumigaleata]